ncbi:MAG: chlorite dismutase family protein [Candidatus Microthrix parvicella]|jgi:peroxiredoxin|uniref:Coproheme decarboxylase n=1 Tax=Candidatus Neomicrothrix parvicella RN1 TaxID=1229780 RepID=R4YX95_9ACTN|nr:MULTISPECIES: chlorite dismutase family protein [Microthrix]MBK6503823.1 chlorite dismutase family protein [Candidatus Microthrix sp.]MBP7993842.1 chlorite dismutase family protein [Candidatus Microthrix sp.]CCM62984.1 Chlorite dismutase [Candidatus Microthrix parvicella RN1]
MTTPSEPKEGQAVVHLFFSVPATADRAAVESAMKRGNDGDDQAICAALLGHKADLGVMALASDQWRLRALQTDLVAAGLRLEDSYVSLTEVSEYAKGMPESRLQERLFPTLPPEGKPAFCFYPMSKRRGPGSNWFTLPYEQRKALMYEHGGSGRKFAGRVTQLITGSTGLDEFEWGVTLFAQHPDDLKEVVYTMRFDEASARYAEFGQFWVGMLDEPAAVLDAVGLT